MQQPLPLWFGVYGREYHVKEPAFFDADQFAWSSHLRDQFPAIKAALKPLMELHSTDLQPYFDSSLQDPPSNWKTIGFYFWGKRDEKNLQRFPKMAEVLGEIPGLVTCSFNMLEPHSRILPHYGETNAAFRVHLGISVPTGLPDCGFRVLDEERPWVEGDVFVFLDANKHEAFNNSDQRRYILLLDIMRPEFMHLKRRVCVQALSMLSLYFVLTKVPGLPMKKIADQEIVLPRWLINGLLLPFKAAWYFLWRMKLWGLNRIGEKR